MNFPQRFMAKARPRKAGLNRTEAAYEQLLDARQRAGEIAGYWTQAMTFKLGTDCRYTPDFAVQEADGTFTLVEIKGFMRDDALVKFRAAADKWPCFRWQMVSRAEGEWRVIRDSHESEA